MAEISGRRARVGQQGRGRGLLLASLGRVRLLLCFDYGPRIQPPFHILRDGPYEIVSIRRPRYIVCCLAVATQVAGREISIFPPSPTTSKGLPQFLQVILFSITGLPLGHCITAPKLTIEPGTTVCRAASAVFLCEFPVLDTLNFVQPTLIASEHQQ